MKKKFQRTLGMSLALMLTVSLFGCSTSKDNGESTEKTNTKQDITPLHKYNPPITMTTAFLIDETIESHKYVQGEDAENNAVYKMYEDYMGIKIKNKILGTPVTYREKMLLAIASQDIPDAALVDQPMLQAMIKGGCIEDQTDYYNKYASDNLKTVLGQSNNVLFQPSTKLGKIMAIPEPTTIYDYMPVVWIRKDWREKLNIPLPKTMEDIFEMAKTFTTKDPDGNNSNDTMGIYMKNDIPAVKYIMNAYGVYPNIASSNAMMWMKDSSGNYYNGSTDQKAKPILAKLNELYKIGAIDKDFATKDTTKANQDLAAGKIGIYFGNFATPLGGMNNSHKNNPNCEWEAISVPPAAGVAEYVPGVPLNVYGYLFVRKGYEHPEALTVMLNHLCDGYGATWLNKNGTTEFEKRYNEIASDPKYKGKQINLWMPFLLAGNKNWGTDFKAAFDAGKKTLVGKQSDYDNVIKADPIESWPWKKVYLEGYQKSDYKKVKYSDYNGAPTDTWSNNKTLLENEVLNSYKAYINGTKTMDDFDNFVKRFNDIGGTKIAEEIKNAQK